MRKTVTSSMMELFNVGTADFMSRGMSKEKAASMSIQINIAAVRDCFVEQVNKVTGEAFDISDMGVAYINANDTVTVMYRGKVFEVDRNPEFLKLIQDPNVSVHQAVMSPVSLFTFHLVEESDERHATYLRALEKSKALTNRALENSKTYSEHSRPNEKLN